MKIFLKAVTLLIVVSFLHSAFKTTVTAAVIGPDKYYLNVTDSSPQDETLKIYSSNMQTKPYRVYIYVYGMKKIGSENDKQFYVPDKNDLNDVANWITLSKSDETIYPDSDTLFSWELRPPEGNLNCGTFTAGIVIAEDPIDNNINAVSASVKNEVISQVIVTITKDSDPECVDNENLNLIDFKVDATLPIFNYDNIPFKTTIENNSKYLARNMKGFIELKGLNGKVAIPFNENGYDIYPNTTKIFSNEWVDSNYPKDNILEQFIYEVRNFKFGRYEVTLGITKNVQHPIIATTFVWIIPWKIIVTFLLIIICIFLFIRNNYRTRKELQELRKGRKHKII